VGVAVGEHDHVARAERHRRLALLGRFDRGGSAGLVVPASYVEVVITRR
jgi:hypothetical protein